MLCSILELYTEKWYNVTDIDYRKKEASFMSLLGKKKKTKYARNQKSYRGDSGRKSRKKKEELYDEYYEDEEYYGDDEYYEDY